VRAVLLDALGTLVELEPPAPLLAARLGVTEAEAAVALREEIRFYRAHHDEASDRAGLEDLRDRCTEVLRAALPERVRAAPGLREALLASLRFRAFGEVPEVLRALRARGAALVVVSNWDVSLHDVLAETGLAPLVDGVVTSAELGAAKPDPAPFRAALALAGAEPQDALHVGDSVAHDVAGARAAGIAPVLVVRAGADGGAPRAPGVRTVADLRALL